MFLRLVTWTPLAHRLKEIFVLLLLRHSTLKPPFPINLFPLRHSSLKPCFLLHILMFASKIPIIKTLICLDLTNWSLHWNSILLYVLFIITRLAVNMAFIDFCLPNSWLIFYSIDWYDISSHTIYHKFDFLSNACDLYKTTRSNL